MLEFAQLKVEVHTLLLDTLRVEYESSTARALASAADATHEEAKPEGSKDTRATEMSYLAQGQAKRAVNLETEFRSLQYLDPGPHQEDTSIHAPALIQLSSLEDDSELFLYLCPFGSGRKLRLENISVSVVSAKTPLGKALLGKHVGDEFELRIQGQEREYAIMKAV